jgi:hypothetical protein
MDVSSDFTIPDFGRHAAELFIIEQAGLAVTLWACIRYVIDSNLSCSTAY